MLLFQIFEADARAATMDATAFTGGLRISVTGTAGWLKCDDTKPAGDDNDVSRYPRPLCTSPGFARRRLSE
jgi:hypothetical protein